MIVCHCFYVDEKKIKDFLDTNPTETEWYEFLTTNRISSDCGSCLPCIEKIKESHKSIEDDLDL